MQTFHFSTQSSLAMPDGARACGFRPCKGRSHLLSFPAADKQSEFVNERRNTTQARYGLRFKYTHVNYDSSAKQLSEIAVMAAEEVAPHADDVASTPSHRGRSPWPELPESSRQPRR
jgi:hypothetical protein